MLDSCPLSCLLSGRGEQGEGVEWEFRLSGPADTEN